MKARKGGRQREREIYEKEGEGKDKRDLGQVVKIY